MDNSYTVKKTKEQKAQLTLALNIFKVPYFLRSWVLLLRIKSVMKIKTNLLMTSKKQPFHHVTQYVYGN